MAGWWQPYRDNVASQQGPARRFAGRVARWLDAAEAHLEAGRVDALAWAAAGFAGGIGGWFALAGPLDWLALMFGGAGIALVALISGTSDLWPRLRRLIVGVAIMAAAGCGLIWAKSALIGTPPIAAPQSLHTVARVEARDDAPALDQARLILRLRDVTGRIIAARIAVPLHAMPAGADAGALITARLGLRAPGPPIVPGARDSAREAWFDGIAAVGAAYGRITMLQPAAHRGGWLPIWRTALAAHVQAQIPGSAGGIAATLVSGDRSGVAWEDQQAMRDTGLTHLLAISGLHVSAVVAGVYFATFRLLSLVPWLALRVRLPLVGAAAGALAGVGYTALTGAHLPTVRACLGAVLVLAAMAAGRRAWSIRSLALAAFVVMLAWPEAVVGPAFQLSFGAVLTILAMADARPMGRWLSPREEARWRRWARAGASLAVVGLALNTALLPVALFHFHRAGVYGALANLIAIPLVTLVAMPLLALALALDCVGAGAPAWGLLGFALNALLSVTRGLAAAPGAVSLAPAVSPVAYGVFLAGALWLALWRGRTRWAGLAVALAGAGGIVSARSPDVAISGDARTVAVVQAANPQLMVFSDEASRYARGVLRETLGVAGDPVPLPLAPGAKCNPDFCRLIFTREGRPWSILVARNANLPDPRAMPAACADTDIVVARVPIAPVCRPRLLLADASLLSRIGGIAIDLSVPRITSVAAGEGRHPWWRASANP